MAAYTIASVQTQVQKWVKDQGLKLADSTDYLQLLDDCCQKFSIDAPQLRFEKDITLPTTNISGWTVGECGFEGDDSTFFKDYQVVAIIEIWWDQSSTNLGKYLMLDDWSYEEYRSNAFGNFTRQQSPTAYAIRNVAVDASGTTPNLTLSAAKLRVFIYPPPSSPTTSRLKVYGYRTHTRITSSTVTSSPLEFAPHLVKYVLNLMKSELYLKDGKEQKAAFEISMYEAGVRSARASQAPKRKRTGRMRKGVRVVGLYEDRYPWGA